MCSRPSSRASSATPSPTPNTPSARPLPAWTSSMPSSDRVAPCTASAVKKESEPATLCSDGGACVLVFFTKSTERALTRFGDGELGKGGWCLFCYIKTLASSCESYFFFTVGSFNQGFHGLTFPSHASLFSLIPTSRSWITIMQNRPISLTFAHIPHPPFPSLP